MVLASDEKSGARIRDALHHGLLGALMCVGLVAVAGCDTSPAQTGGKSDAAAEGGEESKAPALPALSQDELAQLYIDNRARFEATEQLPEESFQELKANFMRVANEAEDAHLRANASVVLGSMHESKGDQRAAVSFYRQAAELAPDDVGTHMVLALALAQDKKWEEAIVSQWTVVNMIPDDLMGWLLLGELHVKGGKLDEAAKVYGAYEMRRKGLLDGLTLKQGGEYVKSEAERAACAEALVVANDNGTSLGLMYAFDSDPSPVVRERIAAIMGEQRMSGYRKLLADKLGDEPNAEVKKAMEWAISEIDREPVETAPGPVPEELASKVEAEAKALQEGAAGDPGAEAPDAPAEGSVAPAGDAKDAAAAPAAGEKPPAN